MPGYAKDPSYFARNISLTPAGNISSTTLQAGIEELDSEKTTESYVNTAAASVPTGSKNLLYNGAMQVHQRGTSTASITSGGYYTADRWETSVISLGTWTQSIESDGPTGSGFTKSLKMLCTTADASPASGDRAFLRQKLEGQDLQRIAKGTASAKQITMSFWVKSNVTGTYAVRFYDADNGRNFSSPYTISSAGSWEYKTVTLPADTTGAFDNDNSGSLHVFFWLDAGTQFTSGAFPSAWEANNDANVAPGTVHLGNATSNYWQITGVQLEVGDTATEFEHLPFGVELARCQRYYQQTHQWAGVANTTSVAVVNIWHTPMRANPSFSATGQLSISNFTTADYVQTSASVGSILNQTSTQACIFLGNWNAGLGVGATLFGTRSGQSAIALNAEL